MAPIPIRKTIMASKVKSVEATQKAIDALPLNSGMWKVGTIPGLYIRARATSKSFLLQRRINRVLVKETLGELNVKEAKEQAAARWGKVRVHDVSGKSLRLGDEINQYIEAKVALRKMRPKTVAIARYNADRYLADWKSRSLEDLVRGRGPHELRQLQQRLTKDYGPATSNQVLRLLSAVYRWSQGVNASLPEWPRKAAEIQSIGPRDSALSKEELKAWWHSKEKAKDGSGIEKGVSTLSSIKKTWWLTALLTGARRGSIEALKWADIDLDAKVMTFSKAKADRIYTVPMSDALVRILTAHKNDPETIPGEWVFASPSREGAHLVAVKNTREGIKGPHSLRHTFRTTLANLGAPDDQAKILMGHSLTGVSRGYITSSLVIESLRPLTNAVAEYYRAITNIEW